MPVKTFEQKLDDYKTFIYMLLYDDIDSPVENEEDVEIMREKSKKEYLENPVFNKIFNYNLLMIKGLFLAETKNKIKEISIMADDIIEFLDTLK